jgi:hypothetical protein
MIDEVEEKKMKRLISLALMSLMLLTLHLAAYADGSFSVEYRGCNKNEEYALFIVKDEGIGITPDNPELFNLENILFMDQLTSDAYGRISVNFVAPNFTGGTVFLSGVFQDGKPSFQPIGKGPLEKPIIPPKALTEIEDSAFEGDTFTHVYLGESVTSIGPRAFADCEQLLYIYIPKSVTSIDDIADDAFAGSPNVVIGCPGGAVSSYATEHGIPCEIVG